MIKEAAYWIEKLDLQKHPEGGYFKETYRSEGIIPQASLEGYSGDRNYSTGIYFLLQGDDFSAFHRISSDEMWHFYVGQALDIYVLDDKTKSIQTIRLGNKIESGEVFQVLIPANHWFAARLVYPDSFALVGCTVAPGFDFQDFEMAEVRTLVEEYPQHRALIEALTMS